MKTMIRFRLFLFFHENVGNARLAAAAVKKLRDKTSAKKANRAKGFSYLDELFQHQPCMDKPVTLVTYDMTGFLKQCLDRYVELAGGNVQFKKVSTPFQDDRIARPTKDDTEEKGILQPIASKILMKVLFAAESGPGTGFSRYQVVRRLRPGALPVNVLYSYHRRSEDARFRW